jgi:2-polyprenyl-3-methyl-5-hydroxy-6-metoxy-1,4-benzoquinol methylase
MSLEKLSKVVEWLAAAAQFKFRSWREKPHYEIAPGYLHRRESLYYDDTENTDFWQKEVYEAAREIMRTHKLQTVYDVGCGSGYKLVHILGDFLTTGIDVPETIEIVRSRYPDRVWLVCGFDEVDLPKADLVICSDVIEHVDDPDALMRFLVRSTNGWIVISTPDRDLCYAPKTFDKQWFGPPANATHLREWTMPELRRYVERFVKIERHEITNRPQATQMIVAQTGLAN